MKVNEVKNVVGPERAKPADAHVGDSGGPKDRVSVHASKEVETSIAVAHKAAGNKRAARLERLEAEVRSGGYRPDPGRVAEQILSDAEVDARLAALLKH
jgi:anti-sigma28 factor (negative regulator of flagellin synthesis)